MKRPYNYVNPNHEDLQKTWENSNPKHRFRFIVDFASFIIKDGDGKDVFRSVVMCDGRTVICNTPIDEADPQKAEFIGKTLFEYLQYNFAKETELLAGMLFNEALRDIFRNDEDVITESEWRKEVKHNSLAQYEHRAKQLRRFREYAADEDLWYLCLKLSYYRRLSTAIKQAAKKSYAEYKKKTRFHDKEKWARQTFLLELEDILKPDWILDVPKFLSTQSDIVVELALDQISPKEAALEILHKETGKGKSYIKDLCNSSRRRRLKEKKMMGKKT